jgi:hypothetical protein
MKLVIFLPDQIEKESFFICFFKGFVLRYHLTLGVVYFSADTAVRYLCCQALAKVYGHSFKNKRHFGPLKI